MTKEVPEAWQTWIIIPTSTAKWSEGLDFNRKTERKVKTVQLGSYLISACTMIDYTVTVLFRCIVCTDSKRY